MNIAANGRPSAGPLKVFELNPRFVARDETVKRTKVWFDPADVVVLPQ